LRVVFHILRQLILFFLVALAFVNVVMLAQDFHHFGASLIGAFALVFCPFVYVVFQCGGLQKFYDNAQRDYTDQLERERRRR
jgi:hypothetical protein